MIIAGQSQKMKVKELLKHSLGNVPWSLATADSGFPPKTNKAASSKECPVGGQASK